MPQHFLLSAAARTLTVASVARMRDEEAERVFIRLRWSDNNGDAYCPHCGCPTVYMARRPNATPQPVRQAQGRGCDPGARRADPTGRVPHRGRRAEFHPPSGTDWHDAIRGRGRLME